MTVFSGSTTGITLDGEGTTNNGTINAADYINPITGGSGVNTVRILNSSAANVATITYTPQDVTYEFDDVAYVSDTIDGTGAVINVIATFNSYEVVIANGGANYAVNEGISISGNNLGGSSTANDLFLLITSVSTSGAVLTVTPTGTPSWPQSVVGSLKVLPHGEEFVQVTNTPATGCYFTGINGDGVMVIQPVTIVG